MSPKTHFMLSCVQLEVYAYEAILFNDSATLLFAYCL